MDGDLVTVQLLLDESDGLGAPPGPGRIWGSFSMTVTWSPREVRTWAISMPM